tara:strand:+ start:210 stop:761 length:552 start_codon:yes stop_codon:yes gene_type:complete
MGKNKVIQNVAILAGLFLFILGISCLINNSNFLPENFTEHADQQVTTDNTDQTETTDNADENSDNKDGDKDGDKVEHFSHNGTESVPGCIPKQQLMPQELLPQDSEANQWSNVNPQGSGSLQDKNFLQAGHHVGINTVGQTLRNANMQLRSDPANPQLQVSPWLQTTINPDTNRKSFEIGGCA